MSRLRAGILGATGLVGQQFARIISTHPAFELTGLYASTGSTGRKYSDSIKHMATELKEEVLDMKVASVDSISDMIHEVDVIFSSLPANMGDLERSISRSLPVITKSSAHRMDENVPLIIPEINPDHLALIDHQRRGGSVGFISADPNCSTTQLVLTLKPLERFGIEWVNVSTMQALSGAGYPGVSSMDMIGNIVPHIDQEEEKMESEPLKILGSLWENKSLRTATLNILASCNRVPVVDGHMETVFVKLRSDPDISEVARAMREFRGSEASRNLPSSPERVLVLTDEEGRPQPRLDLMNGGGMSVTVGKLRKSGDIISFTSLSHNTIRGAAGGGVLHAELLKSKGYI